ncbi:hypothetical protein [Oscillibacter sp.]|uniref:hypothetical protein n=1 Tax=Oscillibacter sp. TaxID=1945593 RepID=UPI002D80617F|nr:hypothetical protein [Oscillibacter sp.]
MKKKYSRRQYERLDFISVLGYAASVSLLALAPENIAKILYPLTLLPFTALAVYAAYINAKLPPEERRRISWGLSVFSIHPAVTAALFALFLVLAFFECYLI